MTDENPIERILGDESRRSFMKKSAVTAVGAGAAASGTAAAQVGEDGDGGGGLTEGWKGLIFITNFRPNAKFTFVSPVVEWEPNFGEVQDNWFSEYNTRMIRYINTGETVPLFVAQDADVGEFDSELGFVADVDDDENQPQLFEMDREYTIFGDSQQLLTVNVSPVGEEEEDQVLANDDWWQDGGVEDGGV